MIEILTKAAQRYINEGLSIVPATKDKRPYREWKQYQSERMSMQTYWNLTEKGRLEHLGIICGAVSGNLEVIDIDSKYKKGIEITILKDLHDLYPELRKSLRIQSTPSGGLHLIYKCTNLIEGNQKLAGRIDADGKKVNFIETRGEGGFIVAYPSEGYKLTNDVELPILTLEQRNTIIGHMRTYNEIIEPEKPKFEHQKKTEQSYSTSPFADFNERCNPIELMEQFGYKTIGENNRYIQFTRPNKKAGVSVSYSKEHKHFYYFTSSTDMQPEKAYSPCAILNNYAHQGDWKATYQDLISKGFGSYKPYVEKKIIRQVAYGKQEAPGNLSANAQAELQVLISQLNENCPYGVFWVESRNDGVAIDIEKFLHVCNQMGFQTYHMAIYRQQFGILYQQTDRQFTDVMKAYINENDIELLNDIRGSFEKFMKANRDWIIERIPEVQTDKVLKDDKYNCFKVYDNCIMHITPQGISLKAADEVNKLIFAHQIQEREYSQGGTGKFIDFIDLAIGWTDYTKKFIGWLCHRFKDETIGYMGVLQERTENPKDGGGSGKNLFCSLLAHSNPVYSRPGENIKLDETLLQGWNGEGIFVISDPDKNFPFRQLKEHTTGNVIVKRLYKDYITIPCADVPKIVVPTNYSIDIEDGGLERRVRFLEFTDFFTKVGGVDVYFDAHFVNDWNDEDWAGYDTIIADCIHLWLQGGCKLEKSDLSETGWLKQFQQTYRNAADIVISKIDEWKRQGKISNALFREQVAFYCNENGLKAIPSSRRMNEALTAYCKHYKIDYKSDQSTGFAGDKGRVFGSSTDEIDLF